MALVLMPVAACGSQGVEAGADSVCVFAFTYEDRTYRDVANVDLQVGAKLGTGTIPPCNDTGESDEPSPEVQNAYAVKGLSPKVAIAVGATPKDAMFAAVYSGKDLPR
ncbi:DUF6281 family protein [Streptomyces sp. T-3]|nr:DUF6281 family protein [Streptomyces sp. T-3]